MPSINQLKEMLAEQVKLMRKIHPHPDWKYGGFEELVLDCGTEFTTFSSLDIKRGIPKSCYWNCQQLLKEYSDLIYCEGYALSPGSGYLSIPLKHAWLTNEQKEIIEPTWGADDSVYLGITFSNQWLTSLLNERSAMGREDEISVFEGNYLEEYSFLKQGLPLDSYFKFETLNKINQMPKTEFKTIKKLAPHERQILANKIARAISKPQGWEMDDDADILDPQLTNVQNCHPRIIQLLQATAAVMELIDELIE